MEPITRKELILAGEDIKPITRLEYFLKEAAGGGGGGGLPEVTSADEGKVLAVNASGEWAAESVMINYDADTDSISVSYNQLKNMIEHNKIPYLIYLRQDGDKNEYCLYRLASVFTNGVDDYAAIFTTFSDIHDGFSNVYFYNSSADASPMLAD